MILHFRRPFDRSSVPGRWPFDVASQSLMLTVAPVLPACLMLLPKVRFYWQSPRSNKAGRNTHTDAFILASHEDGQAGGGVFT